MNDVGFTGTRKGLTYLQHEGLRSLLRLIAHRAEAPISFHQGCCVGADEEATILAKQIGYDVIAHPPKQKQYFSVTADSMSDLSWPEKEYYQRNRDIVDQSTTLIACPKQFPPVRRHSGGTWWTVRYAKERGKRVWIVWPNGQLEEYEPS